MPDIWHQYNLVFPDRATATDVAAHNLLPALLQAQEAALLHGWWFLRKQPWKLRYQPCDSASTTVPDLLDVLTSQGHLIRWTRGIYEPETRAFGGSGGMRAAHDLFHIDSCYLLTRAAQSTPPVLGQRETTVLLCSAMLRAAGLDWYEQGDVWGRVAELRPLTPGMLTPYGGAGLVQAMRTLMTTDTRRLCATASSGPLSGYEAWVAGFEQAGQALAEMAGEGRLSRGLRAVLAHHIVFHTNRAGLSFADQAVMSALASDTVFATGHRTISVTQTPTMTRNHVTIDDSSTRLADRLREELTDRLCRNRAIRSTSVEDAFRTVARHLFLPEVAVEQAYADTPVYTKQDTTSGAMISAASQPWMVAAMLEQLDAQRGERIMELGAGTGYNAALIAAVVGQSGHVTTIDVDDDLVTGARAHLAAAGAHNVEVVLGDGALGHPDGAPYDRIIATVGAYDIPTAWLEQLTPKGRLVVPLRLRGTNSRSIVFERNPDGSGWRSVDSRLAVFMPLRGIADDARRIVPLTPDKDVTLQVHKDQNVNERLLAGVLDASRHETWTGVLFPPEVPYEWVELWLCLRLENALMRMNVQSSAVDREQVKPMFPWGSMATTRAADLAYLTTRPAPQAQDGGKLYEIGVIGHGPNAEELAHRVAEEVRVWDRDHRNHQARFELPEAPVVSDPEAGRFVLDRPHHPVTVIWE